MHGILARHAIHDKQGFRRCGQPVQRAEFIEQLRFQTRATGCIQNQHVGQATAGLVNRPAGNRRRLAGRLDLQARYADLRCQLLQLQHRGRATGVEARQHHFASVALRQQPRQFCGRRRLASALESDQHDDCRWLLAQVQRGRPTPEYGDQFIVQDLDERLSGADAAGNLLPQRTPFDLLDQPADYR